MYTSAELAIYRAPGIAGGALGTRRRWLLLGVGLAQGWAGTATERALAWIEIEVMPDPQGRPVLTLHGRAAERARALRAWPNRAEPFTHAEHAIASGSSANRRTTKHERRSGAF